MEINPSPSFSIDLTVESTLDRPDLESIIIATEGVADAVADEVERVATQKASPAP